LVECRQKFEEEKMDRELAIRAGDMAWEELKESLDRGSSASSPGWDSRDVYAHFARWHQLSMEHIRLKLANEPIPPPEADEDTLNDRWAAQDTALSLAEARDRCLQTRAEFRELAFRLTWEQWDAWGEWYCDDILGEHYRHHLQAFRERSGERRR
jgi:hypothetical protein